MQMARKILKKDWATFTDGEFHIENNVWNKGSLDNGKDYTQTLTYNPNNLTSNLKFAWDWPETNHLLAFPEIVAGYKPWSKSGSDDLTARISTIDKFKVDLDYDITGQKDMFNAAFDMWFTKKAHAGSSSITTELMIWTHVGGDIDPDGKKVGSIHQGDFSADIWVANNFNNNGGAHTWRYITLVSKDEIRDDTIDIGKLIDKLVDRKLVSGSDFFNGYEFGAELTGGKGSMTIHDIDHQFTTSQPASEAEVHHAAGADEFLF
jgi:hypothetical protein